jgi:O-antigen/teichoic acid export membrane protein
LSGVLSNLLTFRTNEAVINFYKRGEVEKDPGLCRLALIAGLMLDLAMGLLLFFAVQFFAPTIALLLLKDANATSGVIMYSGIMFATFLRGTGYGLLVAEERFRYVNSLSILEQGVRLALLSIIVLSGITLNFDNIVWTMLIPAALITGAMYFHPVKKLLGVLRRVELARDRIGEYTRFSLSTFASSTLKAGSQNVDTVILGYLTNPTNVGIYNLFRQFLSPIAMMAAPFSAQIYPRFVHAVAERRGEDVRATIKHANELLAKGCAGMLVLITPIVIGFGIWNELQLTNKHFLAYALMGANAYLFQQLWWSRALAISHNPNISLVSNLVYLVLVLTLVYTLTAALGLLGTTLGMLLSALVIYLYWRNVLSRFSS